LQDTWWIYTEDSLGIETFCDEIKKRLGDKDIFFVTKMDKADIGGHIHTSSWDFFKRKMDMISSFD
jgi:hypothetical protein